MIGNVLGVAQELASQCPPHSKIFRNGCCSSAPSDWFSATHSQRTNVAAPGEKAYPISSFTWLLVPVRFDDKNKLKVMKDFLQWMVTDGQKLTQSLLYAPLPEEVIAKEQAAFSKIQ
jgi:hypothetical protein